MTPRNAYIQSCKVFSVQNNNSKKKEEKEKSWEGKIEKGKIISVKLKKTFSLVVSI